MKRNYLAAYVGTVGVLLGVIAALAVLWGEPLEPTLILAGASVLAIALGARLFRS